MEGPGHDPLPRPLRIVYVIATLDDAGSERQLVALATGLNPLAFAPSVIALTRGGQRLEERLSARRVPVRVLGKRRKASLSSFLALVKALRASRPDIVHTWLFTSNAYGRAAALLAGTGAIIASERAEDPWKGPWHKAVDWILARRTQVIIANAQAVASRVRRIVGDGPAIEVIRNGLDWPEVAPISRAELQASDAGPMALFAGRLEPQKNVPRLLRAFRRTVDAFPDASLLLAGQGPLRSDLEALTRHLGLAQHVRFLGYREDLPRIMMSADLFVLPSLWEGLPNVLLEAMAARLPIVASRLPCTEEILSHGEDALLFDPSDEVDMAGCMTSCLSDREAALRRASRAHAKVQGFSTSRMLSEYETLYRRVVLAVGRS